MVDIDLEIHIPGLDLHHERWNYHVMFMDEVHDHIDLLTQCARDWHRAEGRGMLFVGEEQWMIVIKKGFEQDGFPCHFKPAAEVEHEFDTEVPGIDYPQLVAYYDPEMQFILTAEHHPGGQISTYLVQMAEPSP